MSNSGAGGQFNLTAQEHFSLRARGSASDFVFTALVHVTFTANGEQTVSFDRVGPGECRG